MSQDKKFDLDSIRGFATNDTVGRPVLEASSRKAANRPVSPTIVAEETEVSDEQLRRLWDLAPQAVQDKFGRPKNL